MKKQLLTILVVTMLTMVTNAQDYCIQLDDTNAQRVRYLTTSGDILDTKLNGATDYTIEVWVKPTSTSIHGKVILKRWDQFALTLYQDANRRFYYTHYALSGNTFVNSKYNVININAWNHLVVVCNSVTNTVKLFANGVDVTADASGDPTTQTALTLNPSPAAANFYIGYGGSGTYFTGQIDKVRVKNTAETIGSLQSAVTDADYTTDANTAILYSFNEGTGLDSVNEADSNNGIFQCDAADCVAGETWWVNLGTTLSSNEVSLSNSNLKLYPNPAENKVFTIQTKMNETIQEVEIFDTLGKCVNKIDYNDSPSLVNVAVEDFKSGIYIVQIKTSLGIATKKLIVK